MLRELSHTPEREHTLPSDNRPETIAEFGRRDRGLEAYRRWFDLQESFLKGKNILDLGAGQGLFGKELKEKGIDAYVVPFDPILQSEKEKRLGVDTNTNVSGLAQKLPFRDNSFDLVLASFSLPYWSLGYPKQDQVELDRKADEYIERGNQLSSEEVQRYLSIMLPVLSESARVIKKGGKASFAPFDLYLYRTSLATVRNRQELNHLYRILKEQFSREVYGAQLKLIKVKGVTPTIEKDPNNPDESIVPLRPLRLEVTK